MIAVVNVSKKVYPFGVHDYELRINKQVIARFRHKREDGLTVCLQKAAVAAEKAKWEEAARMLEVIESHKNSRPYSCDCRNMMPEDAPLCDCGKNVC